MEAVIWRAAVHMPPNWVITQQGGPSMPPAPSVMPLGMLHWAPRDDVISIQTGSPVSSARTGPSQTVPGNRMHVHPTAELLVQMSSTWMALNTVLNRTSSLPLPQGRPPLPTSLWTPRFSATPHPCPHPIKLGPQISPVSPFSLCPVHQHLLMGYDPGSSTAPSSRLPPRTHPPPEAAWAITPCRGPSIPIRLLLSRKAHSFTPSKSSALSLNHC